MLVTLDRFGKERPVPKLGLFSFAGTGGKGVGPSNFSLLPFDKSLVVADPCGSKH